MALAQILGVAALVVIATFTGTLLGLAVRERWLAPFIDKWKTTRTSNRTLRWHEERIAEAALALSLKAAALVDEDGASLPPDERTFASLGYTLSALLGHIELYTEALRAVDRLPYALVEQERRIAAIRSDLAEPIAATARSGSAWYDASILEEEQCAIGESMIVERGATRDLLGYSEFFQLLREGGDSARSRWITTAARFFSGLRPVNDGRRLRLERLVVHLVDLADTCAPRRVKPIHSDKRLHYSARLMVRRLNPPPVVSATPAPTARPGDGPPAVQAVVDGANHDSAAQTSRIVRIGRHLRRYVWLYLVESALVALAIPTVVRSSSAIVAVLTIGFSVLVTLALIGAIGFGIVAALSGIGALFVMIGYVGIALWPALLGLAGWAAWEGWRSAAAATAGVVVQCIWWVIYERARDNTVTIVKTAWECRSLISGGFGR